MSYMRRRINLYALSLLTLVLASSCESTSGTGKWHPARFELAVDKAEGTAPDTVTFTGRLTGDIDALVMCHPDICFCPRVRSDADSAGTKLTAPLPTTCICYFRCDSLQSAKREYVRSYIYQSPGTYKAAMKLNCLNGTFGDTVVVSVR